MKEDKFSIRQKGGILTEVYDGRKWPVVRCGSVYVTASDTTHRVTQSVLCTPNVQEKKRKASKYTVAVGTTHGHVQSFIKDSELLLPVYQNCQAEEKCLILIKKPKDASKKMLKAQSLQNLSVSDTHLYKHPLDGTLAGSHSRGLTAHLMKEGKASTRTAHGPLTSEAYTSEPRVRRAPQHAAIKGGNLSSGVKGNLSSFVPIPELGIFTPDQHVLRNGTYAQHCHQRDVTTNHVINNNNNKTFDPALHPHHSKTSTYKSHPPPPNTIDHAPGQKPEVKHFSPRHSSKNTSSEISHPSNAYTGSVVSSSTVNSSFEESVKSDGLHNYGLTRRLDVHHQQQVLQEGGVYHSCMDISSLQPRPPHTHTDENFNTLSSTNSDFYSVQSSVTGGGGFDTLRSDTSDVTPNRGDNDKQSSRLGNDERYDHYGFRSARDPPTAPRNTRPQQPSSPPVNKIDPSSRSHSLGDLTSGLTISLVGQKKPDSVMNVADVGGNRDGPNHGRRDLDIHRHTGNTHSVDNVHTGKTGSQDAGRWGSYEKEPRRQYGGTSPRKTTGSILNGARKNIKEGDGQYEVDGEYPHNKQQSDHSYTKPTGTGSGPSALQHIRDRLQKAVLNSQKIFQGSGGGAPVSSSSWKGKNSGNKISHVEVKKSISVDSELSPMSRTTTTFHADSHQVSHTSHVTQPHAPHHPQPPPRHHHPHHPRQPSPILRQNSAPGATTADMSTNRTLPASQLTSHPNALSDESLHRPPPFPQTSAISASCFYSQSHHPYNHLPPSSQPQAQPTPSHPPPYPQSSSHPPTSTFQFSQPPTSTSQFSQPPSGDQSPSKSKRSLPEVPLSETSERIKRFTEIMKSRVSSHSSASTSRNGGYSADGSTGSQATPTRVSSVETTGSDQASRKSSVELSRMGDFQTILETLVPSEDNSTVTSSRVPELQREPRYDRQRDESRGQARNSRDNQTRVMTSEHGDDLVLPSGDHSSDSAHTSGTSTSYNGSTLDSGYTTTNDADNTDHLHNNNNNNNNHKQSQHLPHHHQFSHVPHNHHHQQLQPQHHHHPPHQDNYTNNTTTKKRAPPPPPKHSSNLVNAHRFGSVQNISTAQAHVFPKDKTSQPLPSSGESLYGTLRKVEGTSQFSHHSNHSSQQLVTSGEFPSSTNKGNNNNTSHQGQGHFRSTDERLERDSFNRFGFDNKPSTRRSWDYADRHGLGDGGTAQGLHTASKYEHRYRSSDVLYSTHHSKHNTATYTQHTSTPADRSSDNRINASKIERDADIRFGAGDDLQPPPLPPPPQQHQQQQWYHQQHLQPISHQNHPPPSSQQQQQQQQYYPSAGDWSTHKKQSQQPPANSGLDPKQQQGQGHSHSSSSSSEGGVKQRPVPVSRSHRHARGRTLPGGFRFTDADNPDYGQPSQFNFELSLYHLTQRYDLSPLCLDLPKNLTLKDMMTFKECTVEISLNETLGIPSSPQGKTSHIGSPGSAFTPVKHDGQVQGQPVVLKVKVITFCDVWEEVQKHSLLGRVLEGDILVEINGWFCLGADVPYLRGIVENCQGAITLTVARHKEKDEVRYKGETPAERIKGLEMQISRLDDLVQVRDEKIRDLQSAPTGINPGTDKQVLTMVNGETPCEGMRIGDDEYVV